jgi:hypothetical protein
MIFSTDLESSAGWRTFQHQKELHVKQLKHLDKILLFKLIGLQRIVLISIAIAILIISCEDPYQPELDSKYQQVLVVDGMISNAEPPYTIKLSLSTNVQEPGYVALSGYEVSILDNHGNEEVLSETDAGSYVSSTSGMQGIVGRKYNLLLQSPDGKTYSSDFEMLKEPLGIESVYAEVEYEQSQTFPYEVPGYQFYIDTYTATSDSTYLLWSMTETYQYESDYLMFYSYSSDGILRTVTNSDSLKTCWTTAKAYPYFIENTLALSEPQFTHYPIQFVDTKTRKLSIRYSLLVNQFSISEKAYQYWNGVKIQNTETGNLYATQPYQLRGNVFNINDDNELVLGYFMVAGVEQKRIFVNRPNATVPMYYPVCELNQVDYELYGFMFLGPPPEWPLFVTEDALGNRALPEQSCIDCTLSGGVLEMPEFWEY